MYVRSEVTGRHGQGGDSVQLVGCPREMHEGDFRPGTHTQESHGDGDRDRGSCVRSLSPSQAGRRGNTSRGLRFLGVTSVFVSLHLAGSQSFCLLDTGPESLATASRH